MQTRLKKKKIDARNLKRKKSMGIRYQSGKFNIDITVTFLSYVFFVFNLIWSDRFSLTLPNKPWFLHVCGIRLLKTLWEKEKLLVTSNFSFFHSVFYPFGELSAIFIKFEIVVCKLFQFGRV